MEGTAFEVGSEGDGHHQPPSDPLGVKGKGADPNRRSQGLQPGIPGPTRRRALENGKMRDTHAGGEEEETGSSWSISEETEGEEGRGSPTRDAEIL